MRADKKKVCEDEQEKVCRGSKHSYRRFDNTQKKRKRKQKKVKNVFFNNLGVQGHFCYFFHVNQLIVIFSLFLSCFCFL